MPDAHDALLESIKASIPHLEALLADVSDHWNYEDPVYRFYHHSFTAYSVQASTEAIVTALQALQPQTRLNEDFMTIIQAGTSKVFSAEVNATWLQSTRPLLEAFFHARFFLETVIKYGRELDDAPTTLPSGWAAVLYLFNLR